MEQWVTMSEASQILGVTERTIHRYIKEGKHQSKLEDGRRYILLDNAQTDDRKLTEQMRSEIEYLRSELSETRQTIQQIQQEAAEAQQRSDTIILQLTKQLEKQTFMLEDMRNRSIWHRFKAALGFWNRRVSSAEYSP